MGFSRFVEVGRVVLINYGADAGKLAVIVDIQDSKRVLIDGPQSVTGIHRQIYPLARLSLTDLVIEGMGKNARQKTLEKKFKEQDIMAKWESTSWAKKLSAKKKRANLSDFDRFKVMIAKKQRAKAIAEKL